MSIIASPDSYIFGIDNAVYFDTSGAIGGLPFCNSEEDAEVVVTPLSSSVRWRTTALQPAVC